MSEKFHSIAVECIKPDGVRRVTFKKYAGCDRQQAEIDAAGLRRCGISAEVVELPRERRREVAA
jgi:hypothetical protein